MKKIMAEVGSEECRCPRDPFTGNKRIMEEWRPLIYEDINPNYYLISSLGRIYSLVSNQYKSYFNRYGYCDVSLQLINGKTKTFTVHRLVAAIFCYNPDPENKIYVNHLNTYRNDNAKYNLEYVTNTENVMHQIEFYKKYPFMSPTPEEAYMTGKDNKWNKCNDWTDEQIHIMCDAVSRGYDYKHALEFAGIEYNVNNRKRLSRIIKGERHQDIASQYVFPKGRATRSANINDSKGD